MVISFLWAVVTYVPLLWFVRVTEGMPDPAQRDLLMRQEASRQTGGQVVLTAAEQKLDAYLHRLKEQEMSATPFPPALHFFKAKPLIEKSPVFKLLQKMPKGDVKALSGLLHQSTRNRCRRLEGQGDPTKPNAVIVYFGIQRSWSLWPQVNPKCGLKDKVIRFWQRKNKKVKHCSNSQKSYFWSPLRHSCAARPGCFLWYFIYCSVL